MKITDKIEITNEDNMLLMARYPDNYFDLGIIDCEYGIGEDGKKNHSRSKMAKAKQYKPKNWDSQSPDVAFFNELLRVTKNQIIFGANHFISKTPSDSPSWIVWDKDNGDSDFADCELAWTSIKTATRKVKIRWAGMLQQDMKNKEVRIHPTQKPVPLYKWILDKYTKEGYKILDTNIGSGSHAIACHDYGFELTACDKDADYYKDTIKRIKNHISQTTLF